MGKCGESTGVVLEFEQAAMRGDELPDGMPFYDQAAYTSLRNLYWLYRRSGITREDAAMEKLLIVRERERTRNLDNSRKESEFYNANFWKEIECAANRFGHEQTIENAIAFYKAVYRCGLKEVRE